MTFFVSTVTLRLGSTLLTPRQVMHSCAVVVLLPGPTDSWPSYGPVLRLLPSSLRALAVSHDPTPETSAQH